MIRYIFIITLVCLSIKSTAQDAIQKAVGEFSELKVYDLIQLQLVPADDNRIVIQGENKNSVIVTNKNGKLKVKMNIEKAFNGSETKVVLYYSKLDIIDVNEGAQVTSDYTIKQFDLILKAQEGGIIDVPFETTYTEIKAVTGGIVYAKGLAKNQRITLLTGGSYMGEHLVTENTEVSISAAGEAHVNGSKLVDVKIRAGGDVFIYGNPETITENTALGGRVKRINE
ncbi:DUF2807 domain-containing protein [Tamlana fucoidanivorans]|uniref:DUF2807 domain-containing protein n=1 Tax=Allotamlana fucoidanivorans TaxID=2583814 RepID=A0A5C4SRN9_9FLAO|nr:head GIN domain-containing protein [Tamlana fucoidanivorans]TNJ47080.1 DUF2807 domain-containing protein [Tamlana fucoidanivorans]